ncbi:Protein of unknown function [Nakamurella panacisegetis]|uniref:Glycosyltransferase RgtA/B/C/D-like domain-containing protein n=1 Tax=Nakamurella panacisegetis TaxID=1090615 RepID=A0A1H0IEB0_9ACTN|nr:glycosyltransferase family 39 protein [Nakamurella panacisegetis]SDO29809.1 Protein of unknown function [Nakamurella panacisegetis]
MISVRAARRGVLAFAAVALVIKLVLAATTYGTNDIGHWGDFLAGVRQAGPVGIYGLTFRLSFYNHPPLVGYLLQFVNLISGTGIPYRFTIRALASLADVGSAFLVFELLRRRMPLRRAQFGAIGVAVSPVLILVSGFHGNTDPTFVAFVLLSTYLLADRRMPIAAGAAIAIAIGIKIVPMVVIPALLVFALRRGRREVLRFIAGFLVTFGVTWGPALLLEFTPLRTNVIGYAGFFRSPWGIAQIGHWLGDPGWVAWYAGSGRILVVVICAVVPAVAVWRRPEVVATAIGWSLVAFLALAPTWAVQYMVWPMAASYLIGIGWATVYNATAGIILFMIYNRWSGGLPWYKASATFVVPQYELIAMLVPWLVLVVLGIRGTIRLIPRAPAGPGGTSAEVTPQGKHARPLERKEL